MIFDLFHRKHLSVDDFLMGEDFFRIARECYDRNYSNINFSDFLWTLRSILSADVLDTENGCTEGGFVSLCGHRLFWNSWKYGKTFFHGSSLLISEHGIYTREREEELIKASWVRGVYKNIWIEQFKKMSLLAYEKADMVTCLYDHAKDLQMEFGMSA